MDNATRERLVAEAKELGATMLRAHYPLHPYIHELADREGLLIWSEIPVYALRTRTSARAASASWRAKELRENIVANRNHPSVLGVVGRQRAGGAAGPGPGRLHRAARPRSRASSTRRARSRSRSPATRRRGCQAAYAPIDVLGINDYFGWYTGLGGNIADRDELPAYLDALRACYPSKAIVVTEFGAEANRDGPPRRRARTPSSRTSSATTSACSPRSRG